MSILDFLFGALEGSRFVKKLMTTAAHPIIEKHFRFITFAERMSYIVNNGFVFPSKIECYSLLNLKEGSL